MDKFRGFISLSLVVAIIAIAAIAGGGWWYMAQQRAMVVNTPHASVASNSAENIGTTQIPRQPDTNSLSLIGDPNALGVACYFKGSGQVFWLKRDWQSKTDKGKYFLISGADPNTFEEMEIYDLCFGKDKNHVYRDNSVIAGADPVTFSLLWYAKPGPILFYRNGSGILSFSFSSDQDAAFNGSTVVTGGDAASFRELNPGFDFSPYAKDKNNVYCDGSVIAGADPATTKLSGLNLVVTVNGVVTTFNQSCTQTQK